MTLITKHSHCPVITANAKGTGNLSQLRDSRATEHSAVMYRAPSVLLRLAPSQGPGFGLCSLGQESHKEKDVYVELTDTAALPNLPLRSTAPENISSVAKKHGV